jgi:hypothetical protein
MNLKKYLSANIVVILLMFTFFVGAFSQYIRIVAHKSNDYWVYYRTAKRLDDNNIQEIYTRKDGALPFRYSPATLMLFSWMSTQNEITYRKIWLGLQALFILASLGLLYKTLLLLDSPAPRSCVTFSFLILYRYFLDALYCGQIVGFILFAFTLGLFFWVKNEKHHSNQALLFLLGLKIVPGFMIMINLVSSKTWKEVMRLLWNLFLTILVVHLIYFCWFIFKFGTKNIGEFLPLFKSWIKIVLADQDYFDGSTSKSQALRGVMLRLFGANEIVESIWKLTSVTALIGLFIYWFKLNMTSAKTRVYAYSLGVLAYVLIMPQSLPYQIFKLLIPLTFIINAFMSSHKKIIGLFLFFTVLFCSVATADLLGHRLADFIQYLSLPFYTFIFMGIVLLIEINDYKKVDASLAK